jgi:hypothetical protein
MTTADLDPDDALDAQYARFLAHAPATPSPTTPDRPTMTLQDIHRKPGPGDPSVESHGCLLAPQMRLRHGPDEVRSSPGPFVVSSAVENFRYVAAGTGVVVTPGPRAQDES